MNYINFKIIKKYIKNNNLTIIKFCKLCNISTGTYYKLKHKKDFYITSLFKIDRIIKIGIHNYFK